MGLLKSASKKEKELPERLLKDAISHYSDLRKTGANPDYDHIQKKGTFPIHVSVEKYTIPFENEVYRFPGRIIVVETRDDDDDDDDSDYHSTLSIPSVDPCLFFAGAKENRSHFFNFPMKIV
ncbi:hypothetical protein ABEB36_008366 [Hypothenemus hampei]|uniref:Uncharacterized protein n=1 Tax=Hypothenemus hampei TaxID=57062 RepID=A0ABD1ELN0_HYPHA